MRPGAAAHTRVHLCTAGNPLSGDAHRWGLQGVGGQGSAIGGVSLHSKEELSPFFALTIAVFSTAEGSSCYPTGHLPPSVGKTNINQSGNFIRCHGRGEVLAFHMEISVRGGVVITW